MVDPGIPLGSNALLVQRSNHASVGDALLVASATLATGTPIDLMFTLAFTQSITSSEPVNSGHLVGGYTASFTADDHLGNRVCLVDDGAAGAPDVTSAVLHTFVGQSIALNESLSGGTYASFIGHVDRSIRADASHSAHFYVDPLTAGVDLAADSLHDNSTAAVPEPGTGALLLAGLAGLGAIVARWRQPLARICR